MKLTKINKISRFKQSDWRNFISVLTPKKDKMLLIVLRKTFLN